MRKLICILTILLALAPVYASAEIIYGCDFDADGKEDFVKSRRCKLSEGQQSTVCSKLVVRLSSDNIAQKINFKENKGRARKAYSDFTCSEREDSDSTDLFATNKKGKINKITQIRDTPLANVFEGTWLIEKEGLDSYWVFRANGTFLKKRAGESLNGITHFEGTYSVTDRVISGDFINPGVGRGEIEGNLNKKGKFLMDFIEYWHTPRKVVACVGVRK